MRGGTVQHALSFDPLELYQLTLPPTESAFGVWRHGVTGRLATSFGARRQGKRGKRVEGV